MTYRTLFVRLSTQHKGSQDVHYLHETELQAKKIPGLSRT